EQLDVVVAVVARLVLFFLDGEDIGRALDPREQVGAVVGLEEFVERLDALYDEREIVLPPSANTASMRSCRAPFSRRWTFRRSAKKERRSSATATPLSKRSAQLVPNAFLKRSSWEAAAKFLLLLMSSGSASSASYLFSKLRSDMCSLVIIA